MPEPAMNGLRRPHTKTRNGCGRCKARKVRCDLRPPVCSNCERRKEACDYSTLQVQDSAQLSKDLSVNRQPVQTQLSDYRITIGLELACHFDASTSSTFDLPETPLIWRMDLVRRADCQSFLRQSSLALAALHIMHLRPAQSDIRFLYYKAHAYQNEAYALFRRSIGVVSNENGLDVLAFCVMTAMFHFPASLVEYKVSGGKHGMDIISPLLALRSGALLLGSHADITIHHKSLSGALGRLGADLGTSSFLSIPQNQAALEALEAAILFLKSEGQSTPAMAHAFSMLGKVFTLFPPVPKGWLHVIFWPAMLLDEYFEELRDGRPAAVVAFIYWCAYLNNSVQQWYLDRWPRIAALHEMSKIDSKWYDILAWPRNRFGSCA